MVGIFSLQIDLKPAWLEHLCGCVYCCHWQL